MLMNYLITFANKSFRYNQLLNYKSAKATNNFHGIFRFSPKDLEPDFCQRNAEILRHPRGCGYWLWKPYFIARVLTASSDGDVVFYCDSGTAFLHNITPLIRLPVEF